MKKEILEKLTPITQEEQHILDNKSKVDKELYTNSSNFTVDSNKMLEKGRLIDIRTHTRFAAFPNHNHNYVEIMYMCSGKTVHIVNKSTKIVLEAGDLLFLNQYSSHEILPAKIDDIGINFIVLPEFFDDVLPMLNKGNTLSEFIVDTLRRNSQEASYLYYKVSDILPIQNIVENLICSLLNKQYNYRQLDQVTIGLLFMLLVNYTERIEYKENEGKNNTIVLKTLKYIEENYRDANLTLFANNINLSVSSLSKIVKKEMGKTFKELLQDKRLKVAEQLLKTTEIPITDIIYMIGYDNTSYFHRIFKERYSISPKKYRDMENKDVKSLK